MEPVMWHPSERVIITALDADAIGILQKVDGDDAYLIAFTGCCGGNIVWNYDRTVWCCDGCKRTVRSGSTSYPSKLRVDAGVDQLAEMVASWINIPVHEIEVKIWGGVS